RELHRRAAEALEGVFAEHLDLVLADLARHWELAQEPELSRPYHLLAARQGRDRYAWEGAGAHYRAELRLSSGASAESVRARMELGEEVLKSRGQLHQAIEELQGVVRQAQALGLWELESQALRALGDLCRLIGEAGEGQRLLELAQEVQR